MLAVLVTARAYCYAELAVSSLAVADTIASRLLIAPTHRGMARPSRPGCGLVKYQDGISPNGYPSQY